MNLNAYVRSLILGMLAPITVIAQQPTKTEQAKAEQQAETQKTLSRQELIANSLQAVASNLTNDDKSLTLKATLFALYPKDSVKKYNNDFFLKNRWMRNTQISLGSFIDKTTTINGFTAGLAHDFLNNRDPSIVTIWKKLDVESNNEVLVISSSAQTDFYNDQYNTIINQVLKIANNCFTNKDAGSFSLSVVNNIGRDKLRGITEDITYVRYLAILIKQLNDDINNHYYTIDKENGVSGSPLDLFVSYIVHQYIENPVSLEFAAYTYSLRDKGKEPDIMSADLKDLLNIFSAKIPGSPMDGKGKTVKEIYNYLFDNYKNAVDSIAKQQMLTGTYNYTFRPQDIKYVHAFSLQYLTGLGKKRTIRSSEMNISVGDSVMTDTNKISRNVNRNIAFLQIGINRILFTDKAKASLLETKLAIEGDWITHGYSTTEKHFRPMVNLTLNGRPSAKSPWFKLVAKYDQNTKRVFGLIDIALNLDNSSKKGS